MSKLSTSRLFLSIRFPGIIILVLWVIQIFQTVLGLNFGGLGVYPRRIEGLKGIFASPFIHASKDFMHLIHNSVPLFVSMSLILFFFKKVAYKSIFLIYLMTGTAVWLFGRSVFHIGASGVVYGFVSFIFWNGVFRRNGKSIVLALIILLLYSGMFLGLVPNQPGISWESHLMGAIVGIIVSYLFRHDLETDEITQNAAYIESNGEDYFLERDTFEKSLEDRKHSSSRDWFSNSSW
jgi:membrane associated rhomboid family serine protease